MSSRLAWATTPRVSTTAMRDWPTPVISTCCRRRTSGSGWLEALHASFVQAESVRQPSSVG